MKASFARPLIGKQMIAKNQNYLLLHQKELKMKMIKKINRENAMMKMKSLKNKIKYLI